MLTSSQKDTPKYNPVIKGRKLKDPDMLCENVLINGADKYQKFAMWGNYLMRVAACKVTTVLYKSARMCPAIRTICLVFV